MGETNMTSSYMPQLSAPNQVTWCKIKPRLDNNPINIILSSLHFQTVSEPINSRQMS